MNIVTLDKNTHVTVGVIFVIVVAGFGIEEPSETLRRRGGGRKRRTAKRLLRLLLFEGRAWLEEMESSEGGGGEGE